VRNWIVARNGIVVYINQGIWSHGFVSTITNSHYLFLHQIFRRLYHCPLNTSYWIL